MFKVARFYAGEAAHYIKLVPRFLFVGDTAIQQEFEAEHMIGGRAKAPMQRRAAMIRRKQERDRARLAMGAEYASAYYGKPSKKRKKRYIDGASGASRSTMVAPPTKTSETSGPGSTSWTFGQAPSSSGAHPLGAAPTYEMLMAAGRWSSLVDVELGNYISVGQRFFATSILNGEEISGQVWDVSVDGVHVMSDNDELTFVGVDDLDNAFIDDIPLADVIDFDAYRAEREP